jgi:NusA-like KH domain protein
MAIINMQTMRYINILDKVTNVKTSKCFIYNDTIFFAVPKQMVSKAIGPSALNVKKIQNGLGKKIRIIGEAEGVNEAERFISNIVAPVSFKNIEVKDGFLIINAGNVHNKASLMGRNKIRLDELGQIVKDTFGFELRIV